jgi:four helix bundle protein
MKDFRGLKVWEKAHALALTVYKASAAFPSLERFGMTAQIRRAAASIPANLAEGCGRQSDRELGRYVAIAMGSASELEYHLLLSRDLGYLSAVMHDELAARVVEVKRMLTGLGQRLRQNDRSNARVRRSSVEDGRQVELSAES